MNGRRIYHARGKVLGGSSSINGMIFQRGNPLDYERWGADPGMQSWDYAHCLPYFKRMENCLAAAPDDEFRGHGGPLTLERGPATNPLFEAFFDAAVQAGYPRTEDVNGYRQEGFAPFDRNISRGRRWSAARAYLHPVMDRPNLDAAHPRAGHRGASSTGTAPPASSTCTAAGRHGRRRRHGHPVRRRDQHPAAAAAVRRRQRRRTRRRSGIDVRHDLPGVGENLQDHLEVYIQYALHPAGVHAEVPEAALPALDRGAVAVRACAAQARPTTSRAAASPAATTTSPTRT